MADKTPANDDLGATEREIIKTRLEKAGALRAMGVNPYGNGVTPRHLAVDLQARYGDAPADEIARDPGDWSLAGRVLAVRSFGKAAFLKVRDRSGELQVWVKKDKLGDAGFERFKLLDVGERTVVHREDALKFAEKLEAGQFDVAFADPPYAGEQAALLVALFRLTPFARIFAIEHPADQPMPGDDTRRYGDTGVTFIYAP